jgi:flavodoxin
MATTLFYFTGTGNTLQIAKDLAAQLPDARLAAIAKADPRIGADTDAVGILFPVYGWGMPKIVGEFIDRMEYLDGKTPAKRGRYHNPFVTIKEIMEQR